MDDIMKYASRMDISRMGQIMPKRMAHIMPAPAVPPRCDFPANIAAAALHPEKQFLKVEKVIPRQSGAKTFVLVPDKEKGCERVAPFKAGQFISLRLRIGESVLTRAYSICSSPASPFYEITVKPSEGGFAGNWICENLKAGDGVETSAPLGEFTYEPLRDAPAVIAAVGGSGVTPALAMARAVAEGLEDFSLTVLYGSTDRDNILLGDELQAAADSCDRARLVNVLSDDDAEGFEKGYITAELIKKYAPADGAYSLFICGSEQLCRFVRAESEKLGLRRKYIREKLYNATVGENEDDWPAELSGKSFSLTVIRRGEAVTVPCSSTETVLCAVERSGILAASGCRTGECGMCRAKLSAGEVYIPGRLEHRKMADMEYGFIHPCCSFPKSDITIELASEKGAERKGPPPMPAGPERIKHD